MTQWIDQPGPEDEPIVRVEDELVEGEQAGDVDDGVADSLQGASGGTDQRGDGAEQRAGGEPAKKHGDPLR